MSAVIIFAMAKKPKQDRKPHQTLGEKIHERVLAAEVAAEEAATYGALTEAVEAVEAAADPEHEAGAHRHHRRDDDADKPAEESSSSKP